MDMTWNEAVSEIKNKIPCTRYLKKSPHSMGPDYYCCPFCHSGEGPNGTGAMKYIDDSKHKNLVYCYSCNNEGTEKLYSVIDLHMNDTGEDFPTAVRELADELRITITDEPTPEDKQGTRRMKTARKTSETSATVNNTSGNDTSVKNDPNNGYPPEWNMDDTEPDTGTTDNKTTEDKPAAGRKPNTPNKYREYCLKCAADVDKTDYLINQGLEPEVYKRYNVGYDTETDQITFPYNQEFSYITRRKAVKNLPSNEKYRKPKGDEAGSEPLCYPEELYTGEPCFVVEGPIDALSIIQAGGHACAVCGNGEEALIDQIKQRLPDAPLIIWKDIDLPKKDGKRPGQDSQEKLVKRLEEEHIPYIEAVYNLDNFGLDHGDPNDLLQADSFLFTLAVDDNIDYADTLKEYGPNVGSLLNEIYTDRYRPLPTGITALDGLLAGDRNAQGGFIRQTLVLLGARPCSGKTILAQTIAESLAQEGNEVYYMCFEMSRTQLITRSLSRIMYTDKSISMTTNSVKILQGYNHSEEMRKGVKAAARIYADRIDPFIKYNPFTEDNIANVDVLLSKLDDIGKDRKAAGRPGPIVFIDYLHLLESETRRDQSEIIKKACTGLKNYAIKYNTIVVAIEAQNREANKAHKAVQEGGRDTSNLEYSGDLILSLLTDEQNDPDAPEDKKIPKDHLRLFVTKSRFTAYDSDKYIEFVKHGGQSYLEPLDGEFRDVRPEDNIPYEQGTMITDDGTLKASF